MTLLHRNSFSSPAKASRWSIKERWVTIRKIPGCQLCVTPSIKAISEKLLTTYWHKGLVASSPVILILKEMLLPCEHHLSETAFSDSGGRDYIAWFLNYLLLFIVLPQTLVSPQKHLLRPCGNVRFKIGALHTELESFVF